MGVSAFRVSRRGQMALPVAARRRWGLDGGGSVDVADLGDVLLVVPSGGGGLRGLLRQAIDDAGGYSVLAEAASSSDPDLA